MQHCDLYSVFACASSSSSSSSSPTSLPILVSCPSTPFLLDNYEPWECTHDDSFFFHGHVSIETVQSPPERLDPAAPSDGSPRAVDLFAANSNVPIDVDRGGRGGGGGVGEDNEVVVEEEAPVLVKIFVKSDDPCIYDGYIWRKYGQKNIKDRKFPRSYFRCAEAGCRVKKTAENSSEKEGYIEATYKGTHNHH